jgi:formate dehydrogenase subunit gamma
MATSAQRPRYLARFSPTERSIHWIHAAAFLVLLGSGLVLYVPALSESIGNRLLVKDIHLWTAVGWACALALIVLLGDRKGLLRTIRELEAFDVDDRRWLRGQGAPQGRFNAGQKLNAAVTGALAVLLTVSGLMLWLSERFSVFRIGGSIVVHDWATFASVAILLGHLYFAVVHPATRHALRGITIGTVREDWAREHHSKWVDELERQSSSDLVGSGTLAQHRASRTTGEEQP